MARRTCFVLSGVLILLLSLSGGALAGGTRAAPDSTLTSLLAQSQALQDSRRWVALDSVAAVAVARAENKRPPDSTALALALFFRGNARYARGLYSDSLCPALLWRSIRIQSRVARADTGHWVAAYDVLARELTDGDRPDSAIAVLAAGRRICRPQVKDGDSLLAGLWISTGFAHRRGDQYDRAIAAFDSARVLRERRYGPEHPAVAEAIADIGGILGRANRLEEAEKTLERALGILERTLGPNAPQLTAPLSELSNVQHHAGDYARSIETLERNASILARNNGPDSPRLIPPLYNIGLRLNEYGDFAGAHAIYKALVPRAEASFGAGNSRTESVRYMAGVTALKLDDTTAAVQYLTRARAAFAGKPLDQNHMANAIEGEYSDLLMRRGDLATARRVVAEGLAREKASGQLIDDVLIELLDAQARVAIASHDQAATDSALAEMESRWGDPKKTEGIYHGDYLRARADLERLRGRRDLAWDFALRAEAIDHDRLLRNARALPDQRALQLAGQLSEPIDVLVSLSGSAVGASRADGAPAAAGSVGAGSAADAVTAAWDRVVRWRGLVTEELAKRRLPHAALADTALAAAHAHWVEALRRTARLEVAGEESGADASALAVARAQAEAAERRYGALAEARGIEHDTKPVDLGHIRTALAAGQALVSIVTVDAKSDTARLIAFATLGALGALHRVDLGSVRELRPRIEAWRVALATPPARGDEKRAERACRDLGAQVRARTWDRLAPSIEGAKSVVLVADGDLADLPWQALPVGKDRYLVDAGPEIQTPGSEREILQAASSEGRGLLALGDPDFERADTSVEAVPAAAVARANLTDDNLRSLIKDCSGTALSSLPPLPGARAEVDEIARAWTAAHPGEPATLLVGAAGSERVFKADAPGHAVLHIATHGILLGDECEPVHAGTRGVGGVAVLTPEKPGRTKATAAPAAGAPATAAASGAAGAPATQAAAGAPATVAAAQGGSGPAEGGPALSATAVSPWAGRRVWLALAGANHARTGARDENEGLLTADEVVTLDLADVDWVVLSACQSGVGQQWPLEGSAGMRRAFRLAGARAVIASQWSIADESTREWMRALYAARASSTSSAPAAGGSVGAPASPTTASTTASAKAVSASAAMRAASLTVLEARRREHRTTHPFYWAAFTATGR